MSVDGFIPIVGHSSCTICVDGFHQRNTIITIIKPRICEKKIRQEALIEGYNQAFKDFNKNSLLSLSVGTCSHNNHCPSTAYNVFKSSCPWPCIKSFACILLSTLLSFINLLSESSASPTGFWRPVSTSFWRLLPSNLDFSIRAA